MDKPKYQLVFEALWNDIQAGKFRGGDKLPSEASLVKKFETSRITVGRALRELQQRGVIRRVAGSGSYVADAPIELPSSLLFGLLIPDLGETEIFDPICKAIANSPAASDHALLWGHFNGDPADKQQQARALCRQYIERKVSGVFFAPLEFERDAEKANRAVLAAFKNAGVPVVLLDHRPAASAEAKRHDVVGLNNVQAGYRATQHLISSGCTRIGFLAYHGSTAAIAGRMAGYQMALRENGLEVLEENPAASTHASIEAHKPPGASPETDEAAPFRAPKTPDEAALFREPKTPGGETSADLASSAQPLCGCPPEGKGRIVRDPASPGESVVRASIEGWVCVNDRVAADLMHGLLAAGTRIPEDVRIVGVDDAEFASLLPVPLTTISQPCQAIGEAALATMLERIRQPRLPARDLLFDGELVIRKSCGASLQPAARQTASSGR